MSVFAPARDASRRADLSSTAGDVTVVGKSTVLTGDLNAEGLIQVEGRVEGSLRSSAQVFVAAGGEVVGDVLAAEVVVAGTIRGDILSSSRTEIQTGGAVHGDLSAPRIAIREGGMLNGLLKVGPAVEISAASRAA